MRTKCQWRIYLLQRCELKGSFTNAEDDLVLLGSVLTYSVSVIRGLIFAQLERYLMYLLCLANG